MILPQVLEILVFWLDNETVCGTIKRSVKIMEGDIVEQKHIPLAECKPRSVYRIDSRNLGIGVFNPKSNGFIGIREKFGQEYLFTEYHWDTGPPFGTVCPQNEIDTLPSDIELSEDLDTIDRITQRSVFFDGPTEQGGLGWCFCDTGDSSNKIQPQAVPNKKLFEYLKSLR